MNNDFFLAVKSTLDKEAYDLSVSLGTQAADMDDTVKAQEILSKPDAAIIWQLISVDEVPLDPMYEVAFVIGAKTTNDSGNYDLLQFNSNVNDKFYKGARISVKDYSGASASAEEGYLFVTDVGLAPQQFENESGIRFLSILAKGVRII